MNLDLDVGLNRASLAVDYDTCSAVWIDGPLDQQADQIAAMRPEVVRLDITGVGLPMYELLRGRGIKVVGWRAEVVRVHDPVTC